MRATCALAALAFASLSGIGAGAQTSRPIASKASTYQPGIDVLNYDITIELPDTGAFINGDVTVSLRRNAGTNALWLDLVDSLAVRRVEVNGRVVAATHTNNRIIIPLDGTSDSIGVRVVYDGRVRDGLIVRKDSLGRWTWFGDNWPDRARQWLPTVDHPSDKATVSWKVIAPPQRTVVANGDLVSTRNVTVAGKPMKETRWRESRPVPTYVMAIAAGPLDKYDIVEADCHIGDEGQCVKQSVYVMPENRKWLPGVFSAAGPIVSLYERLVAPFPYEKLAHLQSSTRFGGMENASEIFYDGNLFATPTIRDGLIAHETAHQWFGDAVTEREWGHLWLSEGFATYFAALWTQFSRGDVAFRQEMANIRRQVLADSVVAVRPVIDLSETEYLRLLNTNSYQKGAFVLYMLHQDLGDSAFFRGIRGYYTAHRHGNAVSDDLRAALEKSSGKSLEQFFRQWLMLPGFAEPSIGWAWDSTTASISLSVLQSGARGAYALPLPVIVTDANGQTRRLTVDVPPESRATIALPGNYSARPLSLSFDPDAMLLARITRL